MFFVVLGAGMRSGSVTILADSTDFIGDFINYGISLYALNKSVRLRVFAAIFKAFFIIAISGPVLLYAVMNYNSEQMPDHEMMTSIGVLCIIAHVACFFLLTPLRKGDSNTSSLWMYSLNDLMGNFLIIGASFMVAHTGSAWPDVVAGLIILAIALYCVYVVLRQAYHELKEYDDNKEKNNRVNNRVKVEKDVRTYSEADSRRAK
jgi:Co/Zn/Cd efflux system component